MNQNLVIHFESLIKQMNEVPTKLEKIAIFEDVMQFLLGAGEGFLNYQQMRNSIKNKLHEFLPGIPAEHLHYRILHNELHCKLINYL